MIGQETRAAYDALAARIMGLRDAHLALLDENARLRADLDDYHESFDLYWRAQRRATELWRRGHPERASIAPDTGALTEFLLDDLDTVRAAWLLEKSRADRLESECDVYRAHFQVIQGTTIPEQGRKP